ncbi:MAG TPA: glycosyltransferase [Candidatus Eisenbacteria bacterium]|nr:glycosyltransferase [Candidatus Eisenbacteria bacterium]
MQIAGYILLAAALIGTLSSTVYLGLVLVAVGKFRAESKRLLLPLAADADLPGVSVIKPVHGLEPQLRENIESFFRQDYPRYEILFGADTADDAALEIVREVSARHPRVPSRIIVHGESPWPNPQTYSLHCLSRQAMHNVLVASDSDVEVAGNYLREVVTPLLKPGVAMTTCLYRGKNVGDFWSNQTAMLMSVEEPAGVLVANLLEGMKFGLGPTIAVRREALEEVGGYEKFHDYSANDFILGNLIYKAGHEVRLSSHVIDHIVNQSSFRKMWQNQLRWRVTERYCRPKGYVGMGLIFAMPFGILGLLAGGLLGNWLLGVALFGWAIVNRLIEAYAVGWVVLRDTPLLRKLWLYPTRDLLGFIVWCVSFSGTKIAWRSSKFELQGERMVLRKNAGHPS